MYSDNISEMSLNADAISGCIEKSCLEPDFYGTPFYQSSKETFVINGRLCVVGVKQPHGLCTGLDITANRLFGPQPRTATYVCIWEIAVGDVKGVFSAVDGQVLIAAGNTFKLNFLDAANAPATEYMPLIDPDGKNKAALQHPYSSLLSHISQALREQS